MKISFFNRLDCSVDDEDTPLDLLINKKLDPKEIKDLVPPKKEIKKRGIKIPDGLFPDYFRHTKRSERPADQRKTSEPGGIETEKWGERKSPKILTPKPDRSELPEFNVFDFNFFDILETEEDDVPIGAKLKPLDLTKKEVPKEVEPPKQHLTVRQKAAAGSELRKIHRAERREKYKAEFVKAGRSPEEAEEITRVTFDTRKDKGGRPRTGDPVRRSQRLGIFKGRDSSKHRSKLGDELADKLPQDRISNKKNPKQNPFRDISFKANPALFVPNFKSLKSDPSYGKLMRDKERPLHTDLFKSIDTAVAKAIWKNNAK